MGCVCSQAKRKEYALRYLDLGKTGLKVSQLALGTGMLGAGKEVSIDPGEADGVVRAYLEAGGNLIDTAEAYLGGKSEELLGEILGAHRDDVVLVSKYGRSTTRDALPGRVGNHRKAMMQSVEGSLRRLRTDHIDVYLVHFDDGITPIDEIMRGFDRLVSSGKILYGGLSNFPAWRCAQAGTLAEIRGWAPLSCIEVEYSLLQRTTEREVLPFAKSAALGVLGYSTLAAGVLTERSRTERPDPERASRAGIPPEADLERTVDAMLDVATELSVDAAHVALAWVIAKGVVPVLGARTSAHVRDNLGAAHLRLSAEQIRRLDNASSIPLGYPHALLALTKVEP